MDTTESRAAGRARRLARRILLLALPGIGVYCLTLVGVTAWHGGGWSYGPISVSKVNLRLALGILALAAWYIMRRRAPRHAMPWTAIAARFTVAALSILISVAAAEWFLRRHLDRSQGFGTLDMLREYEDGKPILPRSRHPVSELITLSSNNRLIYELRPDMNKQYGPYRVISNRDGLRETRVHPKQKPPGVLRILGIGDSGMFGWDVPQKGNYLAVVEQMLARNPAIADVEVLNAGVPGYNTQQQVEWLATRGLSFAPDIVIVGWCGNDYDAPFFLYRPRNLMDAEGVLLYRLLFHRQRFFEDTKPEVRLYTSFEKNEIHPDVLDGMGTEGVRRAFTRLRDLGDKHGFHILVFGPKDEVTVALCRELGLPYFNTHAEIPADSVPDEFNVHHMHPSPQGHAVLAEHLTRELLRRGWLAVTVHGAGGQSPPPLR